MDIIFSIFIIALLLFTNAFFVIAEFALVKIRKTRLEQLSNEGNKTAKIALKEVNDINKMLVTSQLGVTIASIALGWVGEATIVKIIEPIIVLLPMVDKSIASHAIAVPISFVLVTLFHVLLGEQLPKCIAIQYPEKFALMIARPMRLSSILLKPFVWLLTTLGDKILCACKLDNSEASLAHSTEELDMLVDASYNEGVLNETEAEMLHNMFKFSDLTAKQVMHPRTDMICIEKTANFDEVTQITLENQYTRYPVFEESIDNILGFVHVKDLYALENKRDKLMPDFMDNIIRPIMLIPETMTLDNLMIEMKKKHEQMAIVIDEFGGTSGLITLEDVLEEIIGEVQDEFDEEETEIKEIAPDVYIANAMMRLDELANYFDLNEDAFEVEDVDTIGGLVLKLTGRIAHVNDTVDFECFTFTVKEVDGARITKLQIKKHIMHELSSEE